MSVFFIVKILVSATVIAFVSEIARKYTNLAGLITAMPITTLLTLFWLYYEEKNLPLLSDFCKSVLLGLFPTTLFFISAIILFKKGWNFYLVLLVSAVFLGIGAYVHQKLIQL